MRNPTGIVYNPGEVVAAQDGTATLVFERICSRNETVECMAYGWSADSDTLVEGHKVAIQSVQSRQGLRAEDGRIWSYDDSVIVVL